ncbi:hypothetical protein ABTE39_19930, partial [Acinetobacter baumannii]
TGMACRPTAGCALESPFGASVDGFKNAQGHSHPERITCRLKKICGGRVRKLIADEIVDWDGVPLLRGN